MNVPTNNRFAIGRYHTYIIYEFYYMIHRWRTLHRSHPPSFPSQSGNNRCQHSIYYHLNNGSNMHHQTISTTIQLVLNHQTTSSDHRRLSRHLSESTSIRLLSTTRTILCGQSANIYTKFE